jgi:hypothetical protein
VHSGSDVSGASSGDDEACARAGGGGGGSGGLTVFFASPLVMVVDTPAPPGPAGAPPGQPGAPTRRRSEVALELLDVETECRLLQRALRASGRADEIGVRFAPATPDSIRAALTLGSRRRANGNTVVHLSAHGHPSALVLEDGHGGAHLLGAQALKELFAAGGDHRAVRLLVVNCCYSEETAMTFVEAGVAHVVASPLQVRRAGGHTSACGRVSVRCVR